MILRLPTSFIKRLIRRVLNLFARPKPAVRVQIIKRDPFRITFNEWKTDEELCRLAAIALQTETVRRMCDCLRNSGLGNYAIHPETSLEVRGILAARCEGYILALNDFESLAVHEKPTRAVEATFAAENEELNT